MPNFNSVPKYCDTLVKMCDLLYFKMGCNETCWNAVEVQSSNWGICSRMTDIKEVEFIKFSNCLYMEYEERIAPHLWLVAPFSKINKQGKEYVWGCLGEKQLFLELRTVWIFLCVSSSRQYSTVNRLSQPYLCN